jgi:AcrR family transcriptional regulator
MNMFTFGVCMSDQPASELTPKARQTRQHILDTALELFAEQGYESTTMREIARRAGCSLGLAYRYYARKEELVLGLYLEMSAETCAQIKALPDASIADRFKQIMHTRLEQSTRYRELLGVLFGAAVNPSSGVNILGERTVDVREQTHEAFIKLVSGSSDAPSESQVESLATVLYSFHFALILFWLYDRSPGQQTTKELLDFTCESLNLIRPVLILPFVGQAVTRFAGIMERVFLAGPA